MSIDRKILAVLRDDPSATAAELAARIYDLERSREGRIVVPDAKRQEISSALHRILKLHAESAEERASSRPRSQARHLRVVE